MSDLTELLARAIEPLDWVRLGLADTQKSAQRRERALHQAQACLSALDAAGYQVVPKEPTPEMTLKGSGGWSIGPKAQAAERVYRAMIAAAPAV